MAPDSWKQLYANLIKQVNSGEIPQARIDDAVTRILRVKMLAGLFNKQSPKDWVTAGQLPAPGSAAHRAFARQAVRESLVLLKNNKHTLPLDPHSSILVAGVGANDIGMQSGGWTVDWQGNHNTNADFPGGTSILGRHRSRAEGRRREGRHAARGRSGGSDCCVRREALRRVSGGPGDSRIHGGGRASRAVEAAAGRAHPGHQCVYLRSPAMGQSRDQPVRCIRGRVAAGLRRRRHSGCPVQTARAAPRPTTSPAA